MPNDNEHDLSSNFDSLPPPSPRTPVRRFMRLIGYNALFAAIVLILFELGLRLVGFEFTPEPPRIELGWPNPQFLENEFLSDPDLIYVPRRYPAKVAAARELRSHPSVVFMGDSTTRGNYEKQLSKIIGKRYPDSDFTYVTLGVTGWSSWSGLQQLRRDVLPLRPRAITINYGWNDHWNYFGLEDKDAARFLWPKDPHLPQALFSHTRLRTGQLVNKGLFALKFWSVDSGQARVPPDDFRANLRQMVRIARGNDIIPILFTAPTSHRRGQEPAYLAKRWLINLEDLVPLHRKYVQIVREVAAAENALLVDLHHEFSQLPRQDLENLFRSDGIHLHPAGNRKIAELIDRTFDQAGLYPRIMDLSPN